MSDETLVRALNEAFSGMSNLVDSDCEVELEQPTFDDILKEEITKALVERDKTWADYIEGGLGILPTKAFFNGDTTVVFFSDNTKVIVKKSKNDKYSEQTAIAFAMVEKLFTSHSSFERFVGELKKEDDVRKAKQSAKQAKLASKQKKLPSKATKK